MKKTIIFLLLSMFTLTMTAVPAKRGIWRNLKLADGTTVRAELYGDERTHYWIGEDKSVYAMTDNVYKRISNAELRNRIAIAQKRFADNESSEIRKVPRAPQRASSYTGDKKSLIILVQFSDMSFSMDNPQAFYDRVANEQGFSEGNFKGSMNDYFKEQSNNQFNLKFDVVGPYTLGTYATYGANTSSGDIDVAKAQLMISSACSMAAQAGTDFTQYDWDGDGTVEEVYVLYAGKGENDGGDDDTVWPHKYQLSSPTTYGGARVYVYACSNELNGSNRVAGIGTICHEFSHCLGFPDMYDIDYSTNGNQYGMGSWDLMCSGSYNGNGYSPAGYTAYEKMVAGWISPVDLSEESKLSVTDWAPIVDGGNAYIMYNPGNSNEFYIWENRQQKGFDASLPASGIMIHHIDYDAAVWTRNIPNTIGTYNDHERITFFAADNDRSTQNESTDTWPQGTNTTFSNGSSPAASVFNTNTATDNKFMNINLTNISVTDGLAAFNFVNLNTSHGEESLLFNETFDKCAGTGGNDGAFTSSGLTSIATAAFTPDNEGWSTANAFGGNLCARFGTTTGGRLNPTVVPGVATSPSFTLNGTTTLSFKAAPYGSDGNTLTLSATGATLSQQTLTMTEGQWTDFTVDITGSGSVTLTFTGTGRFFLDDVKVPDPNTSTGISTISKIADEKHDGAVYNLSGQRVSKSYKGIVISGGRKFVQR